ncbi:MAG: sulfatase-like hydrolase/transferase [Geminicoccaceae bacterium]
MGRPNLLFILSDQHAQRFAGCYGNGFGLTPNLDRLAARGVVFDRAYCPSPICLPSRASLLTGKHPHRHRCWTNSDALPSDEPTYAHALGAAGYRPELIGRMHFVGPDQLHGFVARPIGDHNSNWLGVSGVGHGIFQGTAGPDAISVVRSGAGRAAYEIKDEHTTEVALRRLDEIAAERAAGDQSPFCLTVGLMLPHPPYVVNDEDFDALPEAIEEPEIAAVPAGSDHPWLRWWRDRSGAAGLSTADQRRARRAYAALVRKMDRLIGQILDRLEAAGLADDTLVVYSSDHGDHAGDRGLWWKHTFYDESARIPLIMAWPGVLPAGERRQQVANLVDLPPTFAEALGGEALPDIDGRSLLAVAKDGATPWCDETFSEYCTDTSFDFAHGEYAIQRMLLRGRYKYVYYHGFPDQLFDLETDPLEQHDLSGDPRLAGVRLAMRAATLAGWSPAAIHHTLAEREARKALWAKWGEQVRPADTHRWSVPADEELRLRGFPG